MRTQHRIVAPLLFALATGFASGQALAWASANRFGGSTLHSPGDTTHDNRYGGSTTHVAGEGTEHTNTYGGSSEHGVYGGAEHTTAYGTTAYRPPAYGAYPVYHPPTYVPYYSSGCYGCAAAAGAVVGMAVGAAAASSSTAAATSTAYSSGYAAGTAAATAPPPGATTTTVTTTTTSYAMGVHYATLPPGAMSITKNGTAYYLSGNTWFKPVYGAGGVYYTVVPAP